MIPEDELEELRDTVQDAWRLARAGAVDEGYAALDLGLAWVEACPIDPATGAAEAPDPWRDELVLRYRVELVRFAGHFQVRFPDPAEQRRQELRAQAAALRVKSAGLRERSRRAVESSHELREKSERIHSMRLATQQSGIRSLKSGSHNSHNGTGDTLGQSTGNGSRSSPAPFSPREACMRNDPLAHLPGESWNGRDLTGAQLAGANLREASLAGCDLRGADFTGATLDQANLAHADLRGADLTWAHLQGACLRGADLRGAHLRGARLYGAVLRNARLEGADLREACLGAAELIEATYDALTRWPEGFQPGTVGAVRMPVIQGRGEAGSEAG